jgi:hypothetical protein
MPVVVGGQNSNAGSTGTAAFNNWNRVASPVVQVPRLVYVKPSSFTLDVSSVVAVSGTADRTVTNARVAAWTGSASGTADRTLSAPRAAASTISHSGTADRSTVATRGELSSLGVRHGEFEW